jgi:hypothetical protein
VNSQFAHHVSRRRCLLISTAVALGGFSGCGDAATEPAADCNWMVGQHFVELQPPPTFDNYDVNVGDSIVHSP